MELRVDVERAIRGDSSAFGRAFEHCRPSAIALARTILDDGQAAEDVVQDAFFVAFQRIAELRDASGFQSFLLEIVRKLSIHELGLRNRRRSVELDESIRAPVVEPNLLNRMQAEAIRAETARLPEDRQALYRMYYDEERTLKEVSSQLGLTVDAARKQLHRLRQFLHQRCTKYVYDPDSPAWASATPIVAVVTHAFSDVTTCLLASGNQPQLPVGVPTTMLFGFSTAEAAGSSSPDLTLKYRYGPESRITTLIE